MVFSSLHFLFAFLPLFFIVYYSMGKLFGIRGKNVSLFIFSLLFYAWGEPVYVLLMIYSTILDYTCGRMIEAGEKEGDQKKKKAFLAVSMIGNLGLLAIFKYLAMIVGTANTLLGLVIPVPEITLPIGISFYTFQTMSYSLDVYRGKIEAQRDIINFGAYVAMFPQLIAGPIVRYETVAAELNGRTETAEDFAAGARRFIVGLGKKVLIANTMAQTADSLFAAAPSSLGSLGAWTAIIAYTFQIFFDFSGYSDMAIGLGRMMGFHYPENFNYPYTADSVTDFWRRWHISMSSFFRDYIYIPMGG
nr:MBOAT family protein [Clostridiales bacterium]